MLPLPNVHAPRFLPRAAALILALFAPVAVARAGVVNLTVQHREVAFEVISPAEAAGSQTITAPDFGPFDQSVAGGLHGALMGASQHSTLALTPDGVTFTLHANVFGTATGTAHSTFVVEFDLPNDAPYSLTYTQDPTGTALQNASYTGPHGTTTLSAGESAANFLSAGHYQLSASLFATNTQGATQDLTFTIGAASPAAVPLPPAVWTGAIVIGLILVTRRLLRTVS